MSIRAMLPPALTGQDVVAPVPSFLTLGATPRHASPVEAARIFFGEPVTGLDASDFTLTRNGESVTLSVSVVSIDGATWEISGLGDETTPGGDYVLTFVAAGSGVEDGAGNPVEEDATAAWTNYAPDESLVHHWEFEEELGDWLDSVAGPSNVAFTRQGGASSNTDGFLGRCANFEPGGSDAAEIADAAIAADDLDGVNNDFTYYGWVRLDAATAAFGLGSRFQATGWRLRIDTNGDVRADGFDSGGLKTITLDASANPGASWHFLCIRVRNNELSAYARNGTTGVVTKGAAVLSGRLVATSEDLSLAWTSAGYPNGEADSITAYNRYLSDGELDYVSTYGGTPRGVITDVDEGDWWEIDSVESVDIDFPANVVNLNPSDFQLTKDGVAVPISSPTLTQVDEVGRQWQLSGLAVDTAGAGDYELTLLASGSAKYESGASLAVPNTVTWVNANVLQDAVSYWKFEEDSGAREDSISTVSLAISGTPTVQHDADYGRAVVFDNAGGSYLSAPGIEATWFTDLSDVSFIVRFRATDIDNQTPNFVNLLGVPGVADGQFSLGHTDGVAEFRWANDQGQHTVSLSGLLTMVDDTTYVLVGVADANRIRIFAADENGNLYQNTTAITGGRPGGIPAASTLYVGSDGTYEHEGYIWECGYYARAWSPGEARLFALEKLTYPDLRNRILGFYRFDESNGTRPDFSGNGNDLSETGSVPEGSSAIISKSAHIDRDAGVNYLSRADGSLSADWDGYPITAATFVQPVSFVDSANNVNTIVGKRVGVSVGWGFDIREPTGTNPDNTLMATARSDSAGNIFANLPADYLSAGVWQFAAAVFTDNLDGDAEVRAVGFKEVAGDAVKETSIKTDAAGFEKVTANTADLVLGDQYNKTGAQAADILTDLMLVAARRILDSELEYFFNHEAGRQVA